MITRPRIADQLVAGVSGLLLAALVPADAAEPTLTADCTTEIASYCSGVTPGQDRIVACLLAYEDKVSPRCRLTAYQSSGNLDVRLKGLSGFAKVCSADILQYCSKVQPGAFSVHRTAGNCLCLA